MRKKAARKSGAPVDGELRKVGVKGVFAGSLTTLAETRRAALFLAGSHKQMDSAGRGITGPDQEDPAHTK